MLVFKPSSQPPAVASPPPPLPPSTLSAALTVGPTSADTGNTHIVAPSVSSSSPSPSPSDHINSNVNSDSDPSALASRAEPGSGDQKYHHAGRGPDDNNSHHVEASDSSSHSSTSVTLATAPTVTRSSSLPLYLPSASASAQSPPRSPARGSLRQSPLPVTSPRNFNVSPNSLHSSLSTNPTDSSNPTVSEEVSLTGPWVVVHGGEGKDHTNNRNNSNNKNNNNNSVDVDVEAVIGLTELAGSKSAEPKPTTSGVEGVEAVDSDPRSSSGLSGRDECIPATKPSLSHVSSGTGSGEQKDSGAATHPSDSDMAMEDMAAAPRPQRERDMSCSSTGAGHQLHSQEAQDSQGSHDDAKVLTQTETVAEKEVETPGRHARIILFDSHGRAERGV